MSEPRSKEWRKHQSEGICRAMAEGKCKKVWSKESREKVGAKLRGKRRPLEVVQKVRKANIGKKRSLEVRVAASDRVRKAHAEGKYKMSPEGRAHQVAAAKRANTGRVHSEEQNRRHSEAMTGRTHSEEIVERRSAKMRGRACTAELTKKGPTNHRSISGMLRSGENIIYHFTNLTHFVREHPELFAASDLIWKGTSCNASKRLLFLFGKSKIVPGTWKGWTAYSYVEDKYNCGEDLLNRPWDIPVLR